VVDTTPAPITTPGAPHHVELWVPDLLRAAHEWGWLLTELGWSAFRSWGDGRSWRLGGTYLVVEQSPDLDDDTHRRRRPGLNHLAFHCGPRARLDSLVEAGGQHGWQLMFADRHPYAGGLQHCAGYLENSDGFEVELVSRRQVRGG